MRLFAVVIFYIFLLCIISADGETVSSKGRDEVISYDSIPDFFTLDNYERCMSRPGGTYCLLDVDLANVPGQLYDYIMEYSSFTLKHYNRARLRRGVCVSKRCGLDYDAAQNGKGLVVCLNRTIFQEYGMQVGQVKIQYCNSSNKETRDPDTLDRTFALIMSAVLLLAVSGTIHHLLVQTGRVSENKYASSFSVIKNWKLLTSDSTDTIKSIQGMRFLTMLIVIGFHTFFMMVVGCISNAGFIEGFYDEPMKRVALNTGVVMQTYFVMGGFLLASHMLKEMDRNPLTLRRIPSAILKRILRFLPTVMVAVCLMATWVQRMGSGPLWDSTVGKEHRICRDNWWIQILFIQNYYELEKVCLPQTWYIAADTQLYLVSLVVLTLVVRHRAHAGLLLGAVLVLSVAVTALQTYWLNIPPVRAIFYPEMVVAYFVDNKSFVLGYMSSQANWTGYTLGMLTAYVHYQAQKNKWDLHNSHVLKWLFYASLPVAMYAMWAGEEFHIRNATRLEAVLFNTLDQNLFGVAMCVFILGCIYKCDKILRGCVEWAPLQPLGRLSFCALLLHTSVLRTYAGHMPVPMGGTVYSMMFLMMGTTVLVFALSLVLFLLVEQPSYQLQKIFFSKKTSRAPFHVPEPCSEGVKQKTC